MRKRCFSTVFGKSQYWKASYLNGTPILPVEQGSGNIEKWIGPADDVIT